MRNDLTPPSADLLPPIPILRERLAVALREVDLLRRLIRAADSVRPYRITTADTLTSSTSRQGSPVRPTPSTGAQGKDPTTLTALRVVEEADLHGDVADPKPEGTP